MQRGVVFPHADTGTDPAEIRRFANGVYEQGYAHVLAYDHVLGADPTVHFPWNRSYDIDTPFHEVFTLFAFLAGVAPLELWTGVVILPQRQTALVAKQAVEVDLLSEGRFVLGVGVGWNTVEYQALGSDFTTRGRRADEQIELLRRLWTERSVTFQREHHTVVGAGLTPRPSRSIPIWIGGTSAAAFRRVGRLADGWIPDQQPGAGFAEAWEQISAAATAAGRDAGAIGIHGRIEWDADPRLMTRAAQEWQRAGATHLSINTMKAARGDVDGQLRAFDEAARALDEALY